MEYEHQPVMLKEVLDFLAVKKGGRYIDCTLGGAGYTRELAKRVGEKGEIMSLDLDQNAIANAQKKLVSEKINNVKLVLGNFKNLKELYGENFDDAKGVDGIVLDLGLSSFQLADKERGFSFQNDSPLDMTFGKEVELSTKQIVNHYPLLELTRIFREYGEEKRAYYLAKAIVESRRKKPITTTQELVGIIAAHGPKRFHTKINPATKIFQALRMETNQELDNLKTVLPAAVELLKIGGKLVVVSFHSGEDRIVKQFLKNAPDVKILTKKPLVPEAEEIQINSRSRSAKLRAALKIEKLETDEGHNKFDNF